jgi:hypothetical protein
MIFDRRIIEWADETTPSKWIWFALRVTVSAAIASAMVWVCLAKPTPYSSINVLLWLMCGGLWIGVVAMLMTRPRRNRSVRFDEAARTIEFNRCVFERNLIYRRHIENLVLTFDKIHRVDVTTSRLGNGHFISFRTTEGDVSILAYSRNGIALGDALRTAFHMQNHRGGWTFNHTVIVVCVLTGVVVMIIATAP